MLWVVVAVVVIFLSFWFFESPNPLDSLPGPPKRLFLGNVAEVLFADGRGLFKLIRKYAKVYGDRYVFKVFGRRVLHINGPEDIEVVLSSSRNITKSKPYTFLEPWLGTGLLLSTGKKWHVRRRILTPTFHFNILKNFATIIEDKSRALVSGLRKNEEIEIDVVTAISNFTLYTICETAMGTQLDQDQSSAAIEYKSAISNIGSAMIDRITKFWLHAEFIYSRTQKGKKFTENLIKAQSFADNVILERKKQRTLNKNASDTVVDDFGTKKRLAMLDLLLEAESKGEIDLEGIREEVNTFMFEGHDTTAVALTFGLMLIADHEDVQERLYEECKQVFGDDDRTPTMADLAEMKYLEAVVKETLRLYPSVPFIAREVTDDFQLGDLTVKKGVEVAVHIFDLHRRADIYPDPEAFKPERFLSNEIRHPYAYVPFSAGPRNCIGQRFAMMEMKCVLTEISRNFRLQPRTKGWRPELYSDMVLRSQDPIYVKFIQR